MIWQNPWAWLGLGALAVPVLIHLLGEGRARVLRFPTLRFVEATRPRPLRRTRIHDPWLLVVRLGVLLAAIAAFAQPLLMTRARAHASSTRLSRAIIVDTSASMRRSLAGGARAIDSARAFARQLVKKGTGDMLIETSSPRDVVRGAVQWLQLQTGTRELIVVSDFQAGTLDSTTVLSVPTDVGIDLVHIAVPTSDTVEVRGRAAGVNITARATISASGTTADWTRAGRSTTSSGARLELLTGSAASADAARTAASIVGIDMPVDTSHRVAIVYPGYPQRASLLASTSPNLTSWMTDLVARVIRDSTLARVAETETVTREPLPDGVIAVRDTRGRPAIVASRDGDRLVFIANVRVSSVTSAALIASINRAFSLAPPTSELDPAVISVATLTSWRRPAQPARLGRAAGDQGESDGRWLWVAVLVLLMIETWMRRTRKAARVEQNAHDLAA